MIFTDSTEKQRNLADRGLESKVVGLPYMDTSKECISFDGHHVYIKTEFQNFNKFTGKMIKDNTEFSFSELGLVGAVVYKKFKGCEPLDMPSHVWPIACRTYVRYVMESYLRNEMYHFVKRFSMGARSSILMNATTYEMFIQVMDIMDDNKKIGHRLVSDVEGHKFTSDLYRVPAEAKKKAMERKVFLFAKDEGYIEVQPPRPYTVLSLWNDFTTKSTYSGKTNFGFFMAALDEAYSLGLIKDPYINNEAVLVDTSSPPNNINNSYIREVCEFLWIRHLANGGPSVMTEVTYNFLDGLGRAEFRYKHAYYDSGCGGWAEGIDRSYLDFKPLDFTRNAQPKNISITPVYTCDDMSFANICSISKHGHFKTYDIFRELVKLNHLLLDKTETDITSGYAKFNPEKSHPIRGWLLRTGFYEFFENYTDMFDSVSSEEDIDPALWACHRKFNILKKKIVKSLGDQQFQS